MIQDVKTQPLHDIAMKTVFVHIRKTAGTSFRQNLFKALANRRDQEIRECSIRSSVELNAKVPPAARSQYLNSHDFIAGHFCDIGTYLDMSSWISFIFFRDPIERCVSVYNHMCNDLRDPLHRYCAGASFSNAIDIPELQDEFSNPYYKYLTGCFGERIKPQFLSKKEEVQSLLNKIDYIGITELYELSLSLFSVQSNGAFAFMKPERLNTKITSSGIRLEDIKRRTLAKLIKKNCIDSLIYREALRLFSSRGSWAIATKDASN